MPDGLAARARTLMVQGTTSSAGKSLLVTALCRLFATEGYRVAPFKAQNMSLNAAVTPDGDEIGRAQAVQAEAARIVPSADMNPVLLKPEGDVRCQVIVRGRSIGSFDAGDHAVLRPRLEPAIVESLAALRARFDVVVIEGAGSPAEINLKDRDLANMHTARLADAPVLLVGDIDRGGVFAAFIGTLACLEPDERARIRGFVVNKFRGDAALLAPGLEMLRERTGVPVLGVLPYLRDLGIADEDSVSLDDRAGRRPPRADEVDVVVVRLPRIANHDDVQPLEHEPGVVVRFVDSPAAIAGADLVVLPGSKATVADLAWLRERGIAEAIVERARRGGAVLGICGGCQMLGRWIEDPHAVESLAPRARGLDLLAIDTRYERDKRTTRVLARPLAESLLAEEGGTDTVAGYEIHMGRVDRRPGARAALEILARNGASARAEDGAVDSSGSVVGTSIHGLLENPSVRRALLGRLRATRGLPVPPESPGRSKEHDYDRLAETVRRAIGADVLRRIAGLG